MSPCSAASEPAVTPTSSPPPCPPLRTCAGTTSSETPEARAERRGGERHRRAHPGNGAHVGQRRGGQSGTCARDRELARHARVPLLGDGVVDGGRAEQQGAAQADGQHQGRAGRREAPCGGAQVRRRKEAADRGEPRERRAEHAGGEPRHDRPEEADRRHEEERGHLRCRRGRVRGAGRGRDGEQRHRAGDRQQPADHAPRAEQPWLGRGFGQRVGRRHAGGAPSGGEDGEQRGG